MDKDRLRLFVEALRSGKYIQTSGRLGRVEPDGSCRFCAGGVMVETAIEHGDVSLKRMESPSGFVWYQSLGANIPEDGVGEWGGSIPPMVLDWYGEVYSWSGTFVVNGHAIEYWNDLRERSFDDIAKMIEREYLTEDAE